MAGASKLHLATFFYTPYVVIPHLHPLWKLGPCPRVNTNLFHLLNWQVNNDQSEDRRQRGTVSDVDDGCCRQTGN